MINDLKDFEKFLKICRKQGVTEVSFAGTTVKLGDLPRKEAVEDDSSDDDSERVPTDEDLMFYAVEGGKTA